MTNNEFYITVSITLHGQEIYLLGSLGRDPLSTQGHFAKFVDRLRYLSHRARAKMYYPQKVCS